MQDAGSPTRELENRLCSQATRTRGGDWSFKLRSSVPVVDLQLGRMMEEAELAAHATAWQPRLVMWTGGPALQIIRQQPSGVQASRDLARRYNARSQARSLAQLQELMHFDSGQEPAGVTDD